MTIQPKLQPGHNGEEDPHPLGARFKTFQQAFARGDEAAMRQIVRVIASEMSDPPRGSEGGYDGNPPKHLPARDIEAVDKWTGRRIRETPKSDMNINVDRIEWLFTHGVIEQHHHQAARRLQRDWEVGLIMPYAQMGVIGGGSGRADFTPAQIKIDSLHRFHDAMKAMGSKGAKVVDLVALQAMSVQKAAAAMRVHNLKAQGMLVVALDILAQHYRIA